MVAPRDERDHRLAQAEGGIGERLSASMLAWCRSGFSVHNGVRVRAGAPARRSDFAAGLILLSIYELGGNTFARHLYTR